MDLNPEKMTFVCYSDSARGMMWYGCNAINGDWNDVWWHIPCSFVT